MTNNPVASEIKRFSAVAAFSDGSGTTTAEYPARYTETLNAMQVHSRHDLETMFSLGW